MAKRDPNAGPTWLDWIAHPTAQAVWKAVRMLAAAGLAVVITWLGIAQSLYRENAEILRENAQIRAQAAQLREELQREYLERIEELNAKLSALRTEFAVLQLKYESANTITPERTIRQILNNMPGAAWCKRVEKNEAGDPEFVMAVINRRYQFAYNITLERYAGSTDFEVWPAHIAEAFYENDLVVYENKASLVTMEAVQLPDGKEAYARFWKYYVPAAFGEEYICGTQVTEVGELPVADSTDRVDFYPDMSSVIEAPTPAPPPKGNTRALPAMLRSEYSLLSGLLEGLGGTRK